MTSPEPPDTESDVPEQFRIRQAKRERLLAEGREPYPVDVARTHTLAEIRQAYPDLPANAETGQIVGVAGRVMPAAPESCVSRHCRRAMAHRFRS